MLFKPRNCPNCGIKWQDHARPGVCDLCGYDLSIGGQKAPPSERTVRRDRPDVDRRVHAQAFGRAGYRPLLPGVEVRDPDGLLTSVDPRTLSEFATAMEKILGRQAERGGTGRLNAKRMEKAMQIVLSLYGALPAGSADLFVDSKPGELPIRLTVAAAGQWPEDAKTPPVRQDTAGPVTGRAAKILRIVLFLAAALAWLVIQYLQRHN